MARVSIEAATLARANLGHRRAAGGFAFCPARVVCVDGGSTTGLIERRRTWRPLRYMAMTIMIRKSTSTTAPPIMAVQKTGELVIEGPCASGIW